jgi:F420-dependent oxidoreductase-like protein
MRISINIGGDVLSSPVAPSAVIEQARSAETAGYPAAWTTHFARGTDGLAVMAAAGVATSRIDLGIGIVPIHPRHPMALATEAATIASLCGGRFTLGVGVSHRPVIEALGLDYDHPAEYMREYLQVLCTLLRTGSISHSGRFFTVEASFNVVGATPPSIIVGALGPKMLAAAGEIADGTVTWMAGPRGLSEHIVPLLAKAAADAGRPAPRVVVGVPVAVCDSVEDGRAAVEETFARYNTLQNYRQQFEREGAQSVADLAVFGPADVVRSRFAAIRDAGATELWAVPFPVGADREASLARTSALLTELAPDF